ncbi:hypothetical protein M8494_19905 [Serratia ureilytica]
MRSASNRRRTHRGKHRTLAGGGALLAAWPFETLLLPKAAVQRITDLSAAQSQDLALALKKLTSRYDNLFQCSFPTDGMARRAVQRCRQPTLAAARISIRRCCVQPACANLWSVTRCWRKPSAI